MGQLLPFPALRRKIFLRYRSFISLVCILLLSWSILPLGAYARPVASNSPSSIQSYLDRVTEQVSEFTLDNGMKFIVLPKHEAPVISFFIYGDVGGVDEPDGQTGVAHFLEHLAFKGTSRIGTRNYEEEAQLLDQLDALFERIKAAEAAGNSAEATRLRSEFAELEAQANEYVIQNEFGQIVERAGGVGLNAATSADYTIYFYSLPANKLELWMSLESERFLDPVFREFFKEQDVILEERRMRTDNSPIGTMIEAFLETAFQEHPYRRPVIGYNEDIRNLTRENVQTFFDTYYVPGNLTVSIVGDVEVDQVRELAQVYFGRYRAGATPPEVTIVEPPQQETREITLELPSQPWYLEGYHRPSVNHPDNATYDIISRLLSDGRTSRLYRSLVQEQRVALSAQGFSGFPGDKYPNLMLFYALTAPGSSVETVAEALQTQIERISTEPVSAQELDRVKTQARAELLRTLDSNTGMARLLAEYDAKTGNWRNVFEQLRAIEAVTANDVQRVAQSTFRPENRTIGRILPTSSDN